MQTETHGIERPHPLVLLHIGTNCAGLWNINLQGHAARIEQK